MAAPLIALAAVSFIANAYSGYSKNKSLRAEGALIAEQGKIQYTESLRDAELVRREGEIFSQKQSMQYIASGVELGGSALITLKQTRMYAEEKARSVVRRGEAVRDLSFKKEEIMKREGTSSLIGGVLTGATSALSAYSGGGKVSGYN